MENITRWDHVLAKKMVEGMSEIEGITIYGPKDSKNRIGLITFNIRDLNPLTSPLRSTTTMPLLSARDSVARYH